MELKPEEIGVLDGYLDDYRSLIGDKRTEELFEGTIKGIIGAESLVCAQIANHSPELAASDNGAQRIRRMVNQESTQRSSLDADSLVAKLQERGIRQLQGEDEIWVIHDGSDLRKPYAKEMEALMQVKTLEGDGLVNGYRTINSFGIGKERRGILYHRLFSSTEKDFVSEPEEIQKALRSTIAATKGLGAVIIHCMDSGFDDIAVWATIWEAGQQLVCRLCHMNRLVEQRTATGEWQQVSVQEASKQLKEWALVETEMVVQKRRQSYEKLQPVTAHVAACPIRVRYQVDVRNRNDGEIRYKEVWLVRVALDDVKGKAWYLLTDIPVTDEISATKVFRIYRQRWAAEDTFKVSKECLGWEEVQLLGLEAVRNLVALGWVVAGFLYELGVTFEWAEVRLLARLGGWEERKDPERKPGKMALMRGLRRLFDLAATEAILADEVARHGALPPRLAALIRRQPS